MDLNKADEHAADFHSDNETNIWKSEDEGTKRAVVKKTTKINS